MAGMDARGEGQPRMTGMWFGKSFIVFSSLFLKSMGKPLRNGLTTDAEVGGVGRGSGRSPAIYKAREAPPNRRGAFKGCALEGQRF